MRLRHLGTTASAAALVAAMLFATGPQLAHATTTEGTDAGDTISTAAVISGAETTITGTLTLDTDLADIYAIDVTNPGAFSASTYNSGYGDLALSLFDSAGHLVEYNNRWYGSGGSTLWGTLPPGNSGNMYAPTSAGTYYLAVNPVGGPVAADGSSILGSTPWYDLDTNSPVYGPLNSTAVLGGWTGSATASYVISLGGVGPPTTSTLYAVGWVGADQAGATSASKLYTVNTSTGKATLVGPIELSGAPLSGVSSVAVGLDDMLYAVDNANHRLLTIAKQAVDNIVNATVVGSFGSYDARVTDMAFDRYGYLYGAAPRTSSEEDLSAIVRVDPDGTLRPLDESLPYDTSADGLASAPSGQMYLKAERYLYAVDHQVGTIGTDIRMSRKTTNAADFSPAGTLYTITRPQTDSYNGTGSTLETVNLTTGFVNVIGTDPNVMIAGIAFDTGGGTAPGASADLHIQKSVDNDYPSVGTDVVYTITVSNPWATDVTGMTVTDRVPSGLTFKGADSTDYNSSTGVWTLGTIAGHASATLHITATAVTPGAVTKNVAILGGALYNPGPTAGRARVDVAPVPPGGPTIGVMEGDGRALVSWAPPTNTGGASVEGYRVYRCIDTTTPCVVTKLTTPVDVTGTSYLAQGLTNGTGYRFAVTAVNSAGEGELSNTSTATPHAPTITIASAWPSKGKVYVDFTRTVPYLETQTGYGPVVLGVTGSKGSWTNCTMDGAYCTVKSSAKTVKMRISDDGGTTWVESASANVTRR